MSEVRLLYRPLETKILQRSIFAIYGEEVEESKAGGAKPSESSRALPRRGREHLGFCERSETKDLVTCDRLLYRPPLEDSPVGTHVIGAAIFLLMSRRETKRRTTLNIPNSPP